jgi:hypothetical protein
LVTNDVHDLRLPVVLKLAFETREIVRSREDDVAQFIGEHALPSSRPLSGVSSINMLTFASTLLRTFSFS